MLSSIFEYGPFCLFFFCGLGHLCRGALREIGGPNAMNQFANIAQPKALGRIWNNREDATSRHGGFGKQYAGSCR